LPYNNKQEKTSSQVLRHINSDEYSHDSVLTVVQDINESGDSNDQQT